MKPAVVVITRDRVDEVLRTVAHLRALGEAGEIIVVDNGSTDGTVDALASAFPDVRVIALSTNAGSAGRNVGVRATVAPYVAFCDDDTLWQPGSLPRAAELLDRHPTVALLAARMVVGTDGRLDALSDQLAQSPLPRRAGLPGPRGPRLRGRRSSGAPSAVSRGRWLPPRRS